MAVIVTILLKAGEILVCSKCKKKMSEGEMAHLDLDWYREKPENVYCGTCRQEERPWL